MGWLCCWGCCSTEAAWSPIHCIASSLPKAAHRSPTADCYSLICQVKEAVWLVVKARMESDLQRKEGIGGHIMSSWWLGIPDLGRGCSCCSSDLYPARMHHFGILLTVCVPEIMIGANICSASSFHLINMQAHTYISSFGEEIGVAEKGDT